MAAQKILYECVICGGDLEEITPGKARCLFCKKEQSAPKKADADLMNRANRLRLKNKYFDQALEIYGRIVTDCPDEAEAYWGIVLCRYGIEYVEDKRTGEFLATCHRTIELSIKDDADFIMACEKGTEEQKKYYIEQAEYIDSIQKKSLDISRQEKPYDVFISYKSHDDNGNDTKDSKEAQKIYNKLDRKGFKVFFAEETLKKHAGEEYEPYIYAALKSSKVMILIGSCEDYFEAPWVKNEWTRYLDMIAHGDQKKLIVEYMDMVPEELPQELASIQALNWRDSEAMSNLLINVETFLDYKGGNSELSGVSHDEIANSVYEKQNNEKIRNLQIRFENAIELMDNDAGEAAKSIFDDIIRENPTFSEAYWKRMLISYDANEDSIDKMLVDMSKHPDFIMALKNANPEEMKKYTGVRDKCLKNLELKSQYDIEFNIVIDRYKTLTDSDLSVNECDIENIIKKEPYNVPVLDSAVKLLAFVGIPFLMAVILASPALNPLLGLIVLVEVVVVVHKKFRKYTYTFFAFLVACTMFSSVGDGIGELVKYIYGAMTFGLLIYICVKI